MQLILPDIISEARGLSAGAAGLLLAVGLALWFCGWAWHRFWVVFAVTLAAGVLGLAAGRSAGGQHVLVVGVLSAVAAGMLALEVAKLLAFVTGGSAAWLAVQAVFPHAQELWAAFLAGGLLGVVLFRLWAMLVTSLAGALIVGHAGLILLAELGPFDAPGWAARHAAALNGAVLLAVLAGVAVQAKFGGSEGSGGLAKPAEAPEGKDKNPKPKKPATLPDPAAKPDAGPAPPAVPWWKRSLTLPKPH